jgi:hypothetical protein
MGMGLLLNLTGRNAGTRLYLALHGLDVEPRLTPRFATRDPDIGVTHLTARWKGRLRGPEMQGPIAKLARDIAIQSRAPEFFLMEPPPGAEVAVRIDHRLLSFTMSSARVWSGTRSALFSRLDVVFR